MKNTISFVEAMTQSLVTDLEIMIPNIKELITPDILKSVIKGKLNSSLTLLLSNPPKHDFWRAGETDAPKAIRASNGELHTLRCKQCGLDNPLNEICLSDISTKMQRWVGVFELVEAITAEEGATVTFTGSNPDFNGLPDEVVTVNKGPHWSDRTYRADTLQECLLQALKSEEPEVSEEARLRQIIRNMLPFMVTDSTRCNGDKCRNPWCYSCSMEEEDVKETVAKARQVAQQARAAVEKR